MLLWKTFLLAFTALLPLINPIGSALVFLGLVGDEQPLVFRRLARKIALATFVFLVVIQFVGGLLLQFFGVSLPIVQVTGGIVIAATAWALLFEKDANASTRDKEEELAGCMSRHDQELEGKVFYPFTFPITAGPGTLVVTLTLSAHAADNDLSGRAMANAGIILAAAVLSGSVYFCYCYAPRIIRVIPPSAVHGILRLIAFILMCLGAQIAWNGLSLLGTEWMVHK